MENGVRVLKFALKLNNLFPSDFGESGTGQKGELMSRISKDQVESSERFYRVPKIFTDETSYYYSMRLESKFAYALLRDRFGLSIKNNWVDEENNVFLIYTVQNLGEILGCKKDKVNEIKKELIEYGLLEQVRQGLNRPNRLYVLNVDSNKKAEIKVDENPVVARMTEKPTPTNPVIARTSEFPPSGRLKNRHQDVGNSATNDTDISDTDINKDDDEENNNKEKFNFENQNWKNAVETEKVKLHEKYGTVASALIKNAELFTEEHLVDMSHYWDYLYRALQNEEQRHIKFNLKSEQKPEFYIPLDGPWNSERM